MPERDLFPPQYDSDPIPRTPIRPLGAVSDYVVEVLPFKLEQVRAGEKEVVNEISGAAETFVRSTRIDWVELDRKIDANKPEVNLRDVALLDLVLLRNAIVREGGKIPDNLAAQVKMGAALAGRIPALTYEDLIMINPLSVDPRLIATGDAAKAELDFYETHARIEKSLEATIASMVKAMSALAHEETPEEKRILEATQILNEAFHGSSFSRHAAQTLRGVADDMDKNHFDVFSQYFDKDPEGFNGPSGLYTTTIPCIELLLAGENVLPSTKAEIDASMKYYPRRHVAKIEFAKAASERGYSLLSLASKLGNPPELYAQLERVEAYLTGFRKKHIQAVEQQAPKAYSNERAGSAGKFNVREFLEKRIDQKLVPPLVQ